MIRFDLACIVLILGSCQAAWNVTCDLDLENINEIVQHLPVECQEIYKGGPNSDLYRISLAETNKFKEFYYGLQAYERKASSTPEDKVPEQDKELRFQIYNTTMLGECSEKIVNNSESLSEEDKTKEFYNCLLAKREEMIALIPT